jgi:hypothetical protein
MDTRCHVIDVLLMQQGLTPVDEFNEAQLRGIDMRKLRQESFTSQKHLSMVGEHEQKSKLIRELLREPERPRTSPVIKSDTPKGQPNIEISTKPDRNVSRQYRFTPEQLRIAIAIAEKKEMKNG